MPAPSHRTPRGQSSRLVQPEWLTVPGHYLRPDFVDNPEKQTSYSGKQGPWTKRHAENQHCLAGGQVSGKVRGHFYGVGSERETMLESTYDFATGSGQNIEPFLACTIEMNCQYPFQFSQRIISSENFRSIPKISESFAEGPLDYGIFAYDFGSVMPF